MRSFIAIKLTEEVKGALGTFQKDLINCGADVRWINPDNIHLTLKFLGDINESDVEKISEEINHACKRIKAFEIQLSGTGVFPHIKSPRVVWAGVLNNNSLLELQRLIDQNISKLGFEKEKRRFVPHLTLGRVRSSRGKSGLVKKLELHKNDKFGTIPVMSVSLMKSELSSAGAKYTRIAKILLK